MIPIWLITSNCQLLNCSHLSYCWSCWKLQVLNCPSQLSHPDRSQWSSWWSSCPHWSSHLLWRQWERHASPCPASGVVSTLSGEVCRALAYCDCVGDHLDLTGVALGSLRMPSCMPTASPTIALMMGSTMQRVRPPNHDLLAFRSNNPKRRLLKCLLPLYNYSLFIS